MPGVLYNSIVYGPVNSRRFGISLGINVLPENRKVCSFNCLYCEVGWNNVMVNGSMESFNSRKNIYQSLESRLLDLHDRHLQPDSITFSGNGEPTMHPEFTEIVQDVKQLRNRFVPGTKVTVLSNSTTLHNPRVFKTLLEIENNVMKLDAGSEKLFRLINQPPANIHLDEIVENLKRFNGKLFIQSMFLRGDHLGENVDNTTESEVQKWLKHISDIQPKKVMLYSIDRATPSHTIQKVPYDVMLEIAGRVKDLGIDAEAFD